MNLLQLKQKMCDLMISESYMADACGVSERYLKQIFALSKPSNKTFEKKVAGVIKSIEIGRSSKKKATKTYDVCEKVLDLKKRKEELGVSYREIANKTQKHYCPEYVYQLFTGRRLLNWKAATQIEDALCKIETEKMLGNMENQNNLVREYNEGIVVTNNPEKDVVQVEKHFTTEKPDDKKMVLKGRLIGIREARNIVESVVDEGMPYSDFINITRIILKLDDEIDDLVNQIVDGLK